LRLLIYLFIDAVKIANSMNANSFSASFQLCYSVECLGNRQVHGVHQSRQRPPIPITSKHCGLKHKK
jgi:hypothetical protein